MTNRPMLTDLAGTYVGQLNKPTNKATLEWYVKEGDRSPHTFASYYFWLIGALQDTPAWGKPKTITMVNELTRSVRATLTGAKTGKSSAPAHANKMLNKIAWCSKKPATGNTWGTEELEPLLKPDEVERLLAMCAA